MYIYIYIYIYISPRSGQAGVAGSAFAQGGRHYAPSTLRATPTLIVIIIIIMIIIITIVTITVIVLLSLLLLSLLRLLFMMMMMMTIKTNAIIIFIIDHTIIMIMIPVRVPIHTITYHISLYSRIGARARGCISKGVASE